MLNSVGTFEIQRDRRHDRCSLIITHVLQNREEDGTYDLSATSWGDFTVDIYACNLALSVAQFIPCRDLKSPLVGNTIICWDQRALHHLAQLNDRRDVFTADVYYSSYATIYWRVDDRGPCHRTTIAAARPIQRINGRSEARA
nr:hypothetical protein CFP56_00590 [Quercus suber]